MNNGFKSAVAGLFVAVVAASGCASQKTAAKSAANAGAINASRQQTEPDLRNESLQSVPELKTISFAFDSADLQQDALATLVRNAEWLKMHSEIRAQVAGHCDQRGTIEYNLALGQRRAKAVRDYYLRLGVTPEKIATISYGKEKPVCADSTEACWLQNRRAETLAAFQRAALAR